MSTPINLNSTEKSGEAEHQTKTILNLINKQLCEQKHELESIIGVLTNNEHVTTQLRLELLERLKALLLMMNNSYNKGCDSIDDHCDDSVEVKVEESVYIDVKAENENIQLDNDDKDNMNNVMMSDDYLSEAGESFSCRDYCDYLACSTKYLEQHHIKVHAFDKGRSLSEQLGKLPNEKNQPKVSKQKRRPRKELKNKSEKVKKENICEAENPVAVKRDNEISNSDGGEVRLFCDQCAYSSSVLTNLKLHINNHHSTTQYPCDQCQYVACAKNFLRRHKSRVHGGVRYYCELCEYNTTCMSNLKRHKQSKHEGIKFTCEECNYSATLKQSLQRHISTKHKGIKFACNKCTFAANHISDLNKHKKRMHKEGADNTQICENKCDECHFTAQSHANLKKHKKIKHNFTDL